MVSESWIQVEFTADFIGLSPDVTKSAIGEGARTIVVHSLMSLVSSLV
jgi:hypothetical protein